MATKHDDQNGARKETKLRAHLKARRESTKSLGIYCPQNEAKGVAFEFSRHASEDFTMSYGLYLELQDFPELCRPGTSEAEIATESKRCREALARWRKYLGDRERAMVAKASGRKKAIRVPSKQQQQRAKKLRRMSAGRAMKELLHKVVLRAWLMSEETEAIHAQARTEEYQRLQATIVQAMLAKTMKKPGEEEDQANPLEAAKELRRAVSERFLSAVLDSDPLDMDELAREMEDEPALAADIGECYLEAIGRSETEEVSEQLLALRKVTNERLEALGKD
jgi:hypothetical protein